MRANGIMMACVSVASVLLLATGCSTTRSSLSGPQYRKVDVLLRPEGADMPTRINANDVNEVINLIVACEEAGEWKRAAAISLDATTRFTSKDGSLERDFMRAYIVASFNHGDYEGARKGFGLMSRYPRNVYRPEPQSDQLNSIHDVVFNKRNGRGAGR